MPTIFGNYNGIELAALSCSTPIPTAIFLCPTRAVGYFTKGLSLEQSLDKEGAIATLERLRVDNPDGVALKNYFDDRGGVIDELFGGRVSFQVRWEKQTHRSFEDFDPPQPLISTFRVILYVVLSRVQMLSNIEKTRHAQ